MSWEGRQFLHLNAPLLGFYHEVVVLLSWLIIKQDFLPWSQLQNHSQDRCPLPFQSKINDAWFYWNQPRVVFIIENIQYFWTSHKKPGRYNCSSSKCSMDTFCAARSVILRTQISSSHHCYFYSASLLCFFKPSKVVLPHPDPLSWKKPTFQRLPTYIVLGAWG